MDIKKSCFALEYFRQKIDSSKERKEKSLCWFHFFYGALQHAFENENSSNEEILKKLNRINKGFRFKGKILIDFVNMIFCIVIVKK